MGTNTARLQLYKPDGTEKVLRQLDLNDNWDKLDLLGKRPEPITNPFVKRNTTDAVTSGTDSLFETLTVILKTNHWYEVRSEFRASTSVGIASSPTSTANIRFKAGGTVAIADQPVVRGQPFNCATMNPRHSLGGVFDVPADGTYTLGLTVNSGGAGNTITILPSNGTDNNGYERCFWVKDLGEK